MKALVFEGVVRQLSEEEFPTHPSQTWVACDNSVQVGYTYDGTSFAAPSEPQKTEMQLFEEYKTAIEEVLNSKAKEKMYQSATSIATYTASTNPVWKAEADAFVAWRDAVYVYGLNILSQVQSGGEEPSIPDMIAGMPTLTWPE